MADTAPAKAEQPAQMHDARAERPSIIGPDSGPEAPFPLRMGGKVVSGFGRGSKEVRPHLMIPLLSFVCKLQDLN